MASASESPEGFSMSAGLDAALADLKEDDAAPAPVEAAPAPAGSTPEPTPPAASTPDAAPPAPQSEAQVPTPPPAPTAPAPSPTPEAPYAFRDGIAIHGATALPDGSVKLPRPAVQQIERIALNERALQRQTQQLRQQLHQATQTGTADQEKARTILGKLAEIATWSPEQQVTWWAGYQQQLPTLLAQAEAAHFKRQLEQRTAEVEPIQRQAEWEQSAPVYRGAVASYIDQLVQSDPKYAGLDTAALLDAAWSWADQGLMTRAEQDMPEIGLSRGEMAVNLGLLRRLLDGEAATAKRIADATRTAEQARATAAAQQAATRTNQAALQPQRTPAPPPVVETKDKRPRDENGRFLSANAGFNREWDEFDPLNAD